MSIVFSRSAQQLRTASFIIALMSGAVFTSSASMAAAPGNAVDIDIAKFAYGPKEITVAPGTRITWTNHDQAPHTGTSSDKSFASKGLDTDDRYEHTFAAEGDFGYICTVHPFMTGVVHVRKP